MSIFQSGWKTMSDFLDGPTELCNPWRGGIHLAERAGWLNQGIQHQDMLKSPFLYHACLGCAWLFTKYIGGNKETVTWKPRETKQLTQPVRTFGGFRLLGYGKSSRVSATFQLTTITHWWHSFTQLKHSLLLLKLIELFHSKPHSLHLVQL